MNSNQLSRAAVRAEIRETDRVTLNPERPYTPQTADHLRLWPKIEQTVRETGAWYSTLRAIAGTNRDYVLYLIGDLGVLRCEALEKRLEQKACA